MKALLDTSLGRSFAYLLYSSAARLTSSRVGFSGPSRVGTIIWVRPRSFPGNAPLLVLPEFAEAEVGTHACHAGIFQNPLQFGSTVFSKAGES